MSKNKVEEKPVSIAEYYADLNRRKFDAEAEAFIWMMKHGGGFDNVHMLSAIRNLHMLYLTTVAYQEATHHIKHNEGNHG